MRARQPSGLSILLPVFLLFSSGLGWANSWQHSISSRISTEFESNPAMTPDNPGSVRRALFEPNYTLIGQAGTNELKAGLALQIARSSNQTLSQNREGPSVFFDWLRQSDKGELGISSRYTEIATRDSGIDATGQVPIDSTRASRTISGRWSKSLSERSMLSADGTYEGVSYKGGTLVDYSMQSGGIRLSYALSENSTSFFRLSGDKYVPSGGGPSSQNAAATLGLNWKVENMDLSMQLGKYKVADNTGMQGGATVQYTGQRTLLVLNANRQISSSGLGGFVKADQVVGNWSYALGERDNIGIDLQWLKNNSIALNNTRTNTGAWFQHDINSLWGVRSYYSHNILNGDGVSGASSNILGISLIYTHSNF